MAPKRISTMNVIAMGLLSLASLGAGGAVALNLSEFQRVLRTGLDGEISKIFDGSHAQGSDIRSAASPDDPREVHTKRRSQMRRRIVDDGEHREQISSSSQEDIWNDLLQHAWNTARTIRRDEHKGLSVTSDPQEAYPCPFLICMYGRKEQSMSSDSSLHDIVTLFDKEYEDSLLVTASPHETCLIMSTTAIQAKKVMENYEDSQNLVAMPLIDVTKIHAGTIEEVSSQGWSVPFVRQADKQSASSNKTESLNQWERVIAVDLAPGLGGLKEEAELLDVVNKMMGDIQDMGEVGWLRSMGEAEADQYLVDESLLGVPALSDMFSLTSSLRSINKVDIGNSRIEFWQESLRNGIESEHACSNMFSTLFVKPRAGYFGFDLVLNPVDGPPPQEYESSASNPACVTSLIAGLSTHPQVLSVKANFPIYHGWDVAQKIDSSVEKASGSIK